MAILMIHDNENDTLEHYDQVIQKLAETGQGHPPGRQSHVAVRKGDGYLVADVWESQEAFDDFARVLVPLLLEGGGALPQPQSYPVHNVIEGR